MGTPVVVDIPHSLGREEARRRIADGIGKLPGYLPKGAEVAPRWAGDRLDIVVTLGDARIEGRLDVRDAHVHVEFALPGMFGLLAGPITAALREKGGALLEDKRDDKSR